MTIPQSYMDMVRWLPVKNVSGEECPAFGIIRLSRFDLASGFWEFGKPNQDSYVFGLAINGPVAIANGETGQASRDFPLFAAVEDGGSGSGDGTSGEGNICGPESGSWYLHFDQTGFRALSTTDSELQAVNVDLDPFAVSDDAGSGSGSGSGETCSSDRSFTFNSCDPNTGVQTEITLTFPFPVAYCSTTGSGG